MYFKTPLRLRLDLIWGQKKEGETQYLVCARRAIPWRMRLGPKLKIGEKIRAESNFQMSYRLFRLAQRQTFGIWFLSERLIQRATGSRIDL